jgi:hypothetical protein
VANNFCAKRTAGRRRENTKLGIKRLPAAELGPCTVHDPCYCWYPYPTILAISSHILAIWSHMEVENRSISMMQGPATLQFCAISRDLAAGATRANHHFALLANIEGCRFTTDPNRSGPTPTHSSTHSFVQFTSHTLTSSPNTQRWRIWVVVGERLASSAHTPHINPGGLAAAKTPGPIGAQRRPRPDGEGGKRIATACICIHIRTCVH